MRELNEEREKNVVRISSGTCCQGNRLLWVVLSEIRGCNMGARQSPWPLLMFGWLCWGGQLNSKHAAKYIRNKQQLISHVICCSPQWQFCISDCKSLYKWCILLYQFVNCHYLCPIKLLIFFAKSDGRHIQFGVIENAVIGFFVPGCLFPECLA